MQDDLTGPTAKEDNEERGTMSKDTARIAWVCTAACLVASLVAGMAGCPAGGGGANAPSPPFDATGVYTGIWTATTGLQLTCPLTLTIEQSPNLPFPANFALLGSAKFNYDCILDQALLELVGLAATALTVPLSGTMSLDQAGNIVLSVNTEALDWPFVLELAFDGTGQDTGGDGGMDDHSGAYSLSLTWETEFEGYEDVRVASDGTFDVSLPQ